MENVTQSIPCPSIARNLKKQADENAIWDILEADGCKGEYTTPNGSVVEYEYKPETRQILTRLRVNKLVEAQIIADAAEARELETRGTVGHGINGGQYKLSPFLDTVMRSHGIDPMSDDPDMQKAALKLVERDYKQYKTTNRRLI